MHIDHHLQQRSYFLMPKRHTDRKESTTLPLKTLTQKKKNIYIVTADQYREEPHKFPSPPRPLYMWSRTRPSGSLSWRSAFRIDYCNNQQQVENKITPRMHTHHVPLNCTDKTPAHAPSLTFASLPTPATTELSPFSRVGVGVADTGSRSLVPT